MNEYFFNIFRFVFMFIASVLFFYTTAWIRLKFLKDKQEKMIKRGRHSTTLTVRITKKKLNKRLHLVII
jgi:hypothetical protein